MHAVLPINNFDSIFNPKFWTSDSSLPLSDINDWQHQTWICMIIPGDDTNEAGAAG
jgi:hypothetical protein